MTEEGCGHFQEHAFKKDLCLQCMKPRRLHMQPQPSKRASLTRASVEKELVSSLVSATEDNKASESVRKPGLSLKPAPKSTASTEDVKPPKATKPAPKGAKPTVLAVKPQVSSEGPKLAQGKGGPKKPKPKGVRSPQRPQAPPPEAPVPVFRKTAVNTQGTDEAGSDTNPNESKKDEGLPQHETKPVVEESHYYHKYDIAMKGKTDEDPRRKVLMDKLQSGDIQEISTDSIAMPYTVVDVSKFPPHIEPVTKGDIPPKLPSTPSPQTSASNTLSSNKNSTKTGAGAALAKSESIPSPKARAKLAKHHSSREGSPDISQGMSEPALPIVLYEEAERLKAERRSPAQARKVPIMIQPSRGQSSDSTYEPIEQETEECGEFVRQSSSRSSGSKSEAFEAKKALLSRISFGAGSSSVPPGKAKQESAEESTKNKTEEISQSQVSESVVTENASKPEKVKKGGKSFFKKFLKIGGSKEELEPPSTAAENEEATVAEPAAEAELRTEEPSEIVAPASASPKLMPRSMERQVALSVSDVQSALAKRKTTTVAPVKPIRMEREEGSAVNDTASPFAVKLKPATSNKNLKGVVPKNIKPSESKMMDWESKTFSKKQNMGARLPVENKVIQHSSPSLPLNETESTQSSALEECKESISEEAVALEGKSSDYDLKQNEYRRSVVHTEETKPPSTVAKQQSESSSRLPAVTNIESKAIDKQLEVIIDQTPPAKPRRISPKKKPGVPPPAVPPVQPASPPIGLTENQKLEHSEIATEETAEDKFAVSVDETAKCAEFQVGDEQGTSASEEKALKEMEVSEKTEDLPTASLSRENSFEDGLSRSASSESRSLSMDGQDHAAPRRRGRSEARQSRVSRSMMGAPPPPPAAGASNRNSVSEGSETGSQPSSPVPQSPALISPARRASQPVSPVTQDTPQPTTKPFDTQAGVPLPRATQPVIPLPRATQSVKALPRITLPTSPTRTTSLVTLTSTPGPTPRISKLTLSRSKGKVSPRTLEISGPIDARPMMGGPTIVFSTENKASIDDAPIPKKRFDSVKKHTRNRTVTEGIQLDLQALGAAGTDADDRINELLEKRSSKFLNRALPPPPCQSPVQASASNLMENVYEFVPSDSGKDSSAGTPSRPCYEDIDLDDIYDDPTDLVYSGKSSSASSSSAGSHDSPALQRSQSDDYLEPVRAKVKESSAEENAYPDIIPVSAIQKTKASSTENRPTPTPRVHTPPRTRRQKVITSRMSQHYIMPYINVEMAMDQDRAAITTVDAFKKMSVLNLQTLHSLGEEAFSRYMYPEAELRDDLKWSDFSIGANGIELTLGLLGFYKARCTKTKPHDCYLMVSGKSIPKTLLDLCHVNILNPVCMFRDRISADYFPEPPGSNAQVYQLFGMEQTNIAVLAYTSVQGLPGFVQHMYKKHKCSDIAQFECMGCYVVAQILNGLLYLHEKDQPMTKFHSNDILMVTSASRETYPVLNLAHPAKHVDGQDNQLYESIIMIIFLVLKVQWNKEDDPYTAIPEKSKYSRAFRKLVSMLHQKQFTLQSLITARNILEYILWGPSDQEVVSMNRAEDTEHAFSMWLEVSRCKLVNQYAVSRTDLTLEQASIVRFLCSMTGNSLYDTVKILDIKP